MKQIKTYRLDSEVLGIIEHVKINMLTNHGIKLNNTEVIEMAIRQIGSKIDEKYDFQEIDRHFFDIKN